MTTYQEIKQRLEYLEKWRELAIRPLLQNTHPDDLHMLEREGDDLKLLSIKCLQVRHDMNQNHLPSHELALDDELMVKTSRIPNAGKGLFYEPAPNDDYDEEEEEEEEESNNDRSDGGMNSSNRKNTKQQQISKGSILCFYTGHRHNFHSQKYLVDKSYLLHVGRDILVDPRETLQIKARYINDPLNEALVNCKFVPDPDEYRCKVVATRTIDPGEELYISYGDIYWKQQPYDGTIYHGSIF